MLKLWKALCIAVVAAGMAAPTQAQAQIDICTLLPFLPGCGDDECNCGEEIDALQAEIDAQADAIASLQATAGAQATAIATLEQCCDDNTAAIAALQEDVANIVEVLGLCDVEFPGAPEGRYQECEEGSCTDTYTDENNCGECGNVCAANQECRDADDEGETDGEYNCEFLICPVVDCQNAVLNADGTCSYTNKANGILCSDGLGCTGRPGSPDTCQNGTCSGGGNPCGPTNQQCVEGAEGPGTFECIDQD